MALPQFGPGPAPRLFELTGFGSFLGREGGFEVSSWLRFQSSPELLVAMSRVI